MSISKIRETIQSLNWNRQDATGGTREENKRTNLPAVLAPHIAAVTALEIPARFARDIEAKKCALHAAKLVIEKWNANQNVIQLSAPTLKLSGFTGFKSARAAKAHARHVCGVAA